MTTLKKIALLLILISLLPNTTAISSYWVGSISLSAPDAVNGELTTSIGEWDYIPLFDPDPVVPYVPGDAFVYDGDIWIVTGSWFDPDQFLDEFGSSQQIVVSVVFHTEPANKDLYDKVANGTLTINITLSVVANL